MAVGKPKYPKHIGACIDMLYQMRAERLEAQRVTDKIKEDETALADHIINSFTKEEITGARGKIATAGIKRTAYVKVVDMDKLIEYCKKKKAWDLLQRRVSSDAFKARAEAGEVVPGVESGTTVGLSLTKI